MKSFILLQTTPADSLHHDIQAELAAVAEKISTTPLSELAAELGDKALSFGIKVLIALALYFIGGWIIHINGVNIEFSDFFADLNTGVFDNRKVAKS